MYIEKAASHRYVCMYQSTTGCAMAEEKIRKLLHCFLGASNYCTHNIKDTCPPSRTILSNTKLKKTNDFLYKYVNRATDNRIDSFFFFYYLTQTP